MLDLFRFSGFIVGGMAANFPLQTLCYVLSKSSPANLEIANLNFAQGNTKIGLNFAQTILIHPISTLAYPAPFQLFYLIQNAYILCIQLTHCVTYMYSTMYLSPLSHPT